MLGLFYWCWIEEIYFDVLDTSGLAVFNASDLGDFEESDFTTFDVSGLVALGDRRFVSGLIALGDRRFAFFSGVFGLI